MSTSSIGSTTSFWQQDQNYWQQAQGNANQISATDSVINAIGSAETSLGKGLASIANQTALNRVNTQLSAAIQSLLQSQSDSSTSSSSSSDSSTTSGSTGSAPVPATATGTTPVTMSTPLSILGIPAGGKITVSAGANTTTYESTGSDTIANLMGTINSDLYGTAAVTASLNNNGDLVLTSKNTADTITVGGVYASNVGFGVGNNTFKPTPGSSSSSTSSDASSGSSTASSTSSSSSSKSTAAKKSYTTVASEMLNSAASVLSDSGDGGTLVDMLA
jgi:trimeric autotransporter adhesin